MIASIPVSFIVFLMDDVNTDGLVTIRFLKLTKFTRLYRLFGLFKIMKIFKNFKFLEVAVSSLHVSTDVK